MRDKLLSCDPTPYVITRHNRMMVDGKIVDSTYTIRFLKCEQSVPLGFKFDVGYTQYFYDSKTANWLGQHGGPYFGLIFSYENIDFGCKFKPWTLYSKNDLSIGNNLLYSNTKINPIKLDYLFGYNFYFNNLIIEPAIGYSRSSFIIQKDYQNAYNFKIPKTGGILLNISLSKYFLLKYNEFLIIFGNADYAFVDYSKVSPTLGSGYFDLTLGIAFRGYFKKLELKRI